MVFGTTSRPPARPYLDMATSRFLVRCGELGCELDADILELIPAMATYFVVASWSLLLF